MTVSIRKAVPEEAATLSALALRSKAYWGYSQDFLRSCEAELTYQAHQIEDPKSSFVVAEQGDEVVGFYALETISPQKLELEALFVEPQHIGKGLGRRLMQHAIQAAAAQSVESLFIQGDPNAEAFYLAAGARQVGTRESGSIPGRTLPLFEVLITTDE